MTDLFETARAKARDLTAKEQAPPPVEKWKDGTPKTGEPLKDSKGNELDLDRAGSGDHQYYVSNREAIIAARSNRQVADQRTARAADDAARMQEHKARRERQRATLAAEEAERTAAAKVKDAADFKSKWSIE